jgi:hypothetical protein
MFLTGAVFFAAFFSGAFTAGLVTAAFLQTVFLAGCAFAASARFSAHRFLVAAMIAALPAALSFRFGLAGSSVAGAGGWDSPRILAHRRCWASFIRLRAAAENFLRLRVGASGMAAAWRRPSSI